MEYRILVVDDEPFIVSGVAQMIRHITDFATHVDGFYSAREALEAASSTSYDIMIIDIEMPDMNGLEMIGRIKAGGHSARIILLTGYSDYEYMRDALRQGTYDYVLKMNGMKALRESVVRALTECKAEHDGQTAFGRRQSWETAQAALQDSFTRSDSFISEGMLNPILPFWVIVAAVRGGEKEEESRRFIGRRLTECVGRPVVALKSVEGFCYLMQEAHFFSGGKSVEEVRTLLPELSERLEEEMDCSIRFALSERAMSGAEVADAARRLREQLTEDEEDMAANAGIRQTIHQLQRYMKTHMSEDLSLHKLSGMVHLNPSYLSRLFHRISGCRLSSYVLTIRMERARELLAGSDLQIQEIAEQVGFKNASYFTATFNKMTGTSPQAFRRRSGRKNDPQP